MISILSTQKYLFLFLIVLFFIVLNACTRDKTPVILSPCDSTITYNHDMHIVLDKNCSYAGCHDGYNGIGDYTTFEGVSAYFEGENMKSRVLGIKDMPPLGEVPLTEEELLLFECWIIDRFPEE